MTKRTKLLSLFVTTVLCFVAGFAMMFSSPAKADVVVPDAPSSVMKTDLDWTTTGAGLAIVLDEGVTTDWVVYDFKIPAGATNETTTANVVVADGYLPAGSNVSDGTDWTAGAPAGHGGTIKADAESLDITTLFDNEGTTAKRVRIAFDLANGKVYVSEGEGEYELALTFNSWSNVSGAASKYTYLPIGSTSIKKLEDFKIYTEEGMLESGWRTGNPGNTNAVHWAATKTGSINLPATAVKPYGVEKDYSSASTLKISNKVATTADWIIFEYDLDAGAHFVATNGTLPPQNGFYTYVAEGVAYTAGANANAVQTVNGYKVVGKLYNYAGGIADYTGAFFNAEGGAETHVKVAFNTQNGQIVMEKAGKAYLWNVHPDVATELTVANRFAGFITNSMDVVAEFNNLVCYDSNGNDLGIMTGYNLSLKAPVVDNASIRTEGVSVVSTAASQLFVRTAAPVTSKWVFFEWTNGVNEYVATGSKPGGSGFWILAGKSHAEMMNPPANTNSNSLYYAAMQTDSNDGYSGLLKGNRTTRIAISLEDACMPLVWYDGVQASLSAPLNLNFSYANPINGGEYYAGFWMNAIYEVADGFSATGLRCFDEYGNNIDIQITNADPTLKTVTFMNGSSEHAKYENALPGNSFAQFTDLTAPSGNGNFVGWTATNGGLDFINNSDAVPANGTTVYAKFITDKKDVASYAGMYKCDTSKKYFEITADGKLISYVSGMPSGDVAIYEEAGITVYSLGAKVAKSTVANQITIGNDVFVKTNDYKTVTYSFDGNATWHTLKVPTGFLAMNIIPVKTAHTFVGWYVDDVKFSFGTVINEDVVLTAKLTVNVSNSSSLATYFDVENKDAEDNAIIDSITYYNKAANTLYTIFEDKTYKKTANGTTTSGVFEILFDGSVEYLSFDGNVDSVYRFDNVSADVADNHYTLLFSEYTITLKYGIKGVEDKVLTANLASNYLITMPEDPTRVGYTFKGWAYGDGTAFDATLIQAATCEIYAVWEAVEGGTAVSGGLNILSIVAIIVAAVVALGGVAVFVLWKKGILFVKK